MGVGTGKAGVEEAALEEAGDEAGAFGLEVGAVGAVGRQEFAEFAGLVPDAFAFGFDAVQLGGQGGLAFGDRLQAGQLLLCLERCGLRCAGVEAACG
jgi:hypothetical protein